MGFLFFVERAKTGRAKCKGCQCLIPKDDVKLGIRADVKEGLSPTAKGIAEQVKWYHLDPTCVRSYRKSAQWWETNVPDVKDVTVADEAVSTAELEDIFAKIAAIKEKGSPAKRRRTDSGTSTSATLYDAGLLSRQDADKIREKMERIKNKTNAYLQTQLKLNKQKSAGNKEQLIERVAELSVLGALPKCPDCARALLHFNRETGEYACPGYFDKGTTVKCGFKSTDVQREPWQE